MSAQLEFNSQVDKEIIEGFLSDKNAMLSNLSAAGYSKRAIRERAEKLGLTQSLLAQYDSGEIELTVRTCLNCDEPVTSVGVFNRLCKRCRSRH